jgi:hypothetical protein
LMGSGLLHSVSSPQWKLMDGIPCAKTVLELANATDWTEQKSS